MLIKLLNNLVDAEEYHLKLKFPQLSAWLNKLNGSCQSTYRLNLIGIVWTVRFLCQVFHWSLSFSVFLLLHGFLSGKRCFFLLLLKSHLTTPPVNATFLLLMQSSPKLGYWNLRLWQISTVLFFSCTQMKLYRQKWASPILIKNWWFSQKRTTK